MIIFQNFLESGHIFSDQELPLKFKFRLINTIMIIIVFTSSLFTLLHYLHLAPIGDIHANANLLFALSNLFFIIWLRASKTSYNLIATLMILSGLTAFTSALITVPNDEFRIVWFYITVFLAFFTGGILYGYAAAAASMVIILVSNALFDLNLSSLAITTAVVGLIILTIAVKVYTQKMIDLENALLQHNASLQAEVKSVVEDVRKKDELMLQQTRLAQMGEMIAMIAHQWRQPLSSISAISANIQLSIALEKEIEKEGLKQELQTIDNRVTLLSNTIEDFRNFYKTDNEKSEFNLSKTIDQAIEVLTPASKNADVTLVFDNDLKKSIISLESEIIQVLMNIIKNAIDMLREKEQERKIWIRAYQNGNQTYILIKDNAGGVPKEIIYNIFDPYFSTKKEKHGMGLGLYMSKLIIQEHCGGTLDVKNSNGGAIFTITLPSEQ